MLRFEKVGQTLPWEEAESNAGRNLAVAGAAGSPFLGLIGREKIKNDPFYNRAIKRVRSKDIAEMARAGDVLLTASKGLPFYKAIQAPTYGSEFYHGVAALGDKRFVDAGFLGRHFPETRRGAPGRPADSAGLARMARREGMLGTLGDIVNAPKYRDMVLLRPTAEARKAMGGAKGLRRVTDDIIEKSTLPYGKGHSKLKAGLAELFMPKIPGLGHPALTGGQICKGEVCSTLPGQAMERAGIGEIARGKPAKYLGSPDYLRSSQFEPVAAHLGGKPLFSRRAMSALGLGMRGALGAGMGGAIYAGYEHPELLGVAGGAALGAKALQNTAEEIDLSRLAKKYPRRGINFIGDELLKRHPNTVDHLSMLGDSLQPGGKVELNAAQKLRQAAWRKRTLPLQASGIALGGLGAYYGMQDYPAETAGAIAALLGSQKGYAKIIEKMERHARASGMKPTQATNEAFRKLPSFRALLGRKALGATTSNPNMLPGTVRQLLTRTLPLKAGLAAAAGLPAYGLVKGLSSPEKTWYEEALADAGVPGFTE